MIWFCPGARAQTEITGPVINEYTRILSVHNLDDTDLDSVVVSDASGFSVKDTVMLIQMKGIEIEYKIFGTGTIYNTNNTGYYGFWIINSINGNVITFNATLPGLQPYKTGETGQLVRVPTYNHAVVNSPLTAQPWDPVSKTGGILAMIVNRKLTLNAALDVTGMGFRGGDPSSDDFSGNCAATDPSYQENFYVSSSDDTAGFKGEGVVVDDFSYNRGKRKAINAGGGGNGKYAGGGGGGNWGAGGSGGYEVNTCGFESDFGGEGGQILFNTYYVNSGSFKNRIFMGGGGGTGTQTPPQYEATAGGSGGGLIILIADTLEVPGNDTIRANGSDVDALATAGAGGGGGGGGIVADVSQYKGNVYFEAMGGDGGSTAHVNDTTGPGGGGGGGFLWHSMVGLPGNVTTSFFRGNPGKYNGSNNTYGASIASKGGEQDSLIIPIRGFLFNLVPDDRDICQGQRPDTLKASAPKGGTGSYEYLWEESTDMGSWATADGVPDQRYYAPGVLFDTTHYRRIVISGGTKDTSTVVTVNVLPAIQNNLIAADDTICDGVDPDLLVHAAPPVTGGNGTYTYLWEAAGNGFVWDSAGGDVDGLAYDPDVLRDTTYYRRIVSSHVCVDTSNTVTLTVLDSLRGNIIHEDTTICAFTEPGTLYGETIFGGDPADRRYRWQTSNDKQLWSDAGVTSAFWSPGVMTDTLFFRRILYSGIDDACTDTSNELAVNVNPLITSNIIADDQTICEGDTAQKLIHAGPEPGGGDLIHYAYQWISRGNTGGWSAAEGKNDSALYFPGVLTDSVFYRRVVTSGACRDTSNEIAAYVHPLISDNLIAGNDTVCNGGIPDHVAGQIPGPSGGDGTYYYVWEYRENDTDWQFATGINDQFDYHPGPLTDTTYYQRIIHSGACRNTSDSVQIVVQDAIAGNRIETGTPTYTCYNETITLDYTSDLTSLEGGDEKTYDYLWLQSLGGTAWSTAVPPDTPEDYVSPELQDSVYYKRIVSSGACVDTSAPTLVRIHPLPTGHIKTLTDTFCYDASSGLTLDFEIGLTGTPPWTLEYTDGINSPVILGGIEDMDAQIPVQPVTGDTTTYVYEALGLTDGNGCVANTDSLTGNTAYTVFKLPEIDAPAPDAVCDTMAWLTATADVGSFRWTLEEGDPDLIIHSPRQKTTMVSTKVSGKDTVDYLLRFSAVHGVCAPVGDNTRITFFERPRPAYAGEDTTVFFADRVRLNADPATAGTGTWNVVAGEGDVSDPFDPHATTVDLVLNATTVYKWKVENGPCIVTEDEVAVTRYDMKFYEGFSPNGDAINDYFVVEGLDFADTWELVIYSKQGYEVRKIDHENFTGLSDGKVWDGKTSSGEPVPEGTYYYTLSVTKGGSGHTYSGFVVLKRYKAGNE